ncbi:Sexual development regulator velC, partial [Fusarium oxysporum f. sp. albedinis]
MPSTHPASSGLSLQSPGLAVRAEPPQLPSTGSATAARIDCMGRTGLAPSYHRYSSSWFRAVPTPPASAFSLGLCSRCMQTLECTAGLS